jgi:hypothetical protein
MKIFWSWQSDHSPKTCRHFIRDALSEAVDAAGKELGLEDAERPELDHDTKDAPGMTEIARTILDKISRSAVFVADLTPIGKTEAGKALPNPNVLIELGWALKELGPDRIIGALNTAGGFTADDLPFDIRHRRAMLYELPDGAEKKTKDAAKKKLIGDLTAALRTNLGQYVEDKAAAQDIQGVPAKPDNPSIWATAKDQLEHNDAFGRGHKNTIAMPDCPRGYIRIIPSGWKTRPPSVSEIAALRDDGAVSPSSQGCRDGDFGACEEGYVRYWLTGKTPDGKPETRNVAMYFDETGEFWVLHGNAIGVGTKGSTLYVAPLIDGWSKALKSTFKVYKRFGALPVCKVEAGLVGVRDARWPGTFEFESPRARKDRIVFQCQQRDCGEDAQLEFLTDAYNKVRDLFSLSHVDKDDTSKLIRG